jgi:lipopolysaccharide export system ATP-binding protein
VIKNKKIIYNDKNSIAGVDPVNVNDIKSLVKFLKNDNIGVLITDHNVKETLDICDRAYVLKDGEILSNGNPKQIVNDKNVKKYYLGEDFVY